MALPLDSDKTYESCLNGAAQSRRRLAGDTDTLVCRAQVMWADRQNTCDFRKKILTALLQQFKLHG